MPVPRACESLLAHTRVKILTGCVAAMYFMEGYILMVLLIDTDLECDFISFYQTYLAPFGLLWAIACQIISGFVVDRATMWRVTHRICQVCTVALLLVDPLMFMFGHHNKWLVFVLVMTRYSFLILMNSCVGKIFKMHLVTTKVPQESQLPIINNVSIIGESTMRIIASSLGFFLPLVLIKTYPGMTFNLLKLLAFCFIFSLDWLVAISAFLINEKYYAPPDDALVDLVASEDIPSGRPTPAGSDVEVNLEDLTDAIGGHSDSGSEGSSKKKKKKLINEDNKSSGSSDGDSSSDEGLIQHRKKKNSSSESQKQESGGANQDLPPWDGQGSFFTYCCYTFAKSTLVWNIVMHQFLVMVGFGLIQFVLRFNLAEGGDAEANSDHIENGTNVTRTRAAFCGQLLPNILLQDGLNEVVRVIASVFYYFFLTTMRPWFFWSKMWFISAGVALGLAVATYWPGMDPFLGSLVLSGMYGIVYLQTTFADSTMKAVVPPDIFGFTTAINGACVTIAMLSSAAFSNTKLSSFWNTTTLVIVMAVTILWTIGLSIFNRLKIRSLDQEIEGTTPFMKKWYYCYHD